MTMKDVFKILENLMDEENVKEIIIRAIIWKWWELMKNKNDEESVEELERCSDAYDSVSKYLDVDSLFRGFWPNEDSFNFLS
jgi:ribulose bisphosphate carboxylase small subunit